jgi:ABC-type branched-subunit amino acid transport system ATPase component/ABC-type branched-subunit amino acid transport system permease subunit
VTPKQRRSLAGLGGWVLLALGLVVLPFLLQAQTYLLDQLEYILSLVLVAIGLNIVTGFAGQLSLGPGAIFAVGGYTAAVLANDYPHQVGLLLMCLAAVAAAGIFGLVVGLPALRVGGFYLANMTLFFALLVPIVVSQLAVTNKTSGISLVANPAFNQSPQGFPLYETSLAVVLVLVLMSWALLHSRVGHRFVVLRTSEELAASLGIAGYRTKLLAFFLSALPAGLGGAFYVYTQQFISPGSVSVTLSINLLAAVVIGGLGSVTGPVVGGLLILGLSQFLGGLAQYEGIIFGVLLIGFAILLPDGLVGTGAWLVHRVPALRPRAPLRPALGPTAGEAGAAARATPSALGAAVASARRPRLEAGVDPLGGGAPASTEERTRGPLVAEAVRRSFGGVVAVDGVDLVVQPGSIYGLIGSNGSGKTTMLNLISGFYRLEAGSVRIGHDRLDGRPAYYAAQRGVARTFQTPKLLERGTVVDNVMPAAEVSRPCSGVASMVRLPAGRRADRASRQQALAALERLGLGRLADELAGELPHGTRRLVELARAIALEPQFLLLDEPAAGLSPIELDHLTEAVHAVVDDGVGVLLVEHNVPLVLEVAAEVTVLHRGRELARGSPNEIRRHPEVARVFLGTEVAEIER